MRSVSRFLDMVLGVAAVAMLLLWLPRSSIAARMIYFKDQPYQSNYPENYAKVQTSSQQEEAQLVDFTLCLRFKTEFILREWPFFHKDLNLLLHQSGDYGFIYIKDISYIFIYPMLAPGVWNHLCFTYDTNNDHLIRTIMNGKEIMTKKDPILLSSRSFERGLLKDFVLGRKPSVASGLKGTFKGMLADLSIWSRPMSNDSLKEYMNECKISESPDILDWDKAEFELGDLAEIRNGSANLCSLHTQPSHYHVFGHEVVQSQAVRICSQMGGWLPLPVSLEDAAEVTAQAAENGQLGCQQWAGGQWVPISRDPEGEWRHSVTGVNYSDVLPWQSGQPNGEEKQPCGLLTSAGRLFDMTCSEKVCFNCHFKKASHFTLRGLCDDSMLDKRYTMSFSSFDERYSFKGYSKNVIAYQDGRWEILSMSNASDKYGFYNGSDLYPLGIQDWFLERDICRGVGLTHKKIRLKLSQCNDREYTCSNGLCVDIDQRCDHKSDCLDNSDEMDCHIVSIEKSRYQREFPPVKETRQAIPVSVDLEIRSILHVVELNMEFTAKIRTFLSWYDDRLHFLNLKSEEKKNLVPISEQVQLWIPAFIFGNTDENEALINDEKATVNIKKLGSSTKSSLASIQETPVFEGSENPLVYQRDYVHSFSCRFELEYFPFDIQTCLIEMILPSHMQGYVELFPGKDGATFSGIKETLQYQIKTWNMTQSANGSLSVYVRMQRNFFYHLATTYMPCVCLLIITQVTLFIDEAHFRTTVMVALTAMLVMYTLYQSIARSLPQTSYLKMIDAWLLFGLIMPFFVFLALCITVLMKDEYIREGSPFVLTKRKAAFEDEKGGKTSKRRDGGGNFSFDDWVSKRNFIRGSRCCLPTITVTFVVIYWLVALTYYHSHV